ncbi:MAG: YegS/Rv2252/BmrU family lipid kinase [Bacteroidaceae bacterium]|nr:YegS/Rv2252/BmrU family lipid kinase [Bacteroidaceae bacterium]
MDKKKSAIFIVNPISGTQSKKGVEQKIRQYVDAEKYDFRIVPTRYAGHATEIAAEAAASGVGLVVAVGGDGTINETARSLVHTDTALGIIPCGSGNGLARHLHIPMDVKRAIDILNRGVTECIDYGKINGIPYFCTCGVGFDAYISMKFAQAGKRGLATYIENTVQAGLSYEPDTYEIENEDGTMCYKAFLITCANASQYGNNVYIAPKASLCDGLMDITIMEPFSVLEAPAISFQLFNGTIDQNSKIKTLRSKKVIIHRAKPGVIHYDGDPVMAEATLTVEIIPRGLQVVIGELEERGVLNVGNAIMQNIVDTFNDLKPIGDAIVGDIAARNRRLLVLNRDLLRKLKK